MYVVDAHVHLWYERDLQKLLAGMEEQGVFATVVMDWPKIGGLNFLGLPKLWEVVEPCKNLYLAASIRVSNNPSFSQDLEMLSKWLELDRVVAVKLYPGYDHFYPWDRRAARIYEAALDHKKPVVFHCGETWEKIEFGLVKYSHPLNFDEVAYDFPDLNIVLAHMGYPWMRDCDEVMCRRENVYADISDLLSYEGRYRQRYVDLIRREVLEAISLIGSADRIVFATDWATNGEDREYDAKDYFDFVKSLELEPDEEEAVFFKNAQKLFRIGMGALD